MTWQFRCAVSSIGIRDLALRCVSRRFHFNFNAPPIQHTRNGIGLVLELLYRISKMKSRARCRYNYIQVAWFIRLHVEKKRDFNSSDGKLENHAGENVFSELKNGKRCKTKVAISK